MLDIIYVDGGCGVYAVADEVHHDIVIICSAVEDEKIVHNYSVS
jgi:hypothetical protein